MPNEKTPISQEQKRISPQTYQEVLQGIQLIDIQLRECKFSAKPEAAQINENLTVSWDAEETFEDAGDGHILIDHRYNLKGKSKRTDILKLRVEYRVVISSKEAFTSEFFDIYRRNVLLYTWPYLREHVSSMTASAGLPKLTLPASVVK